MPRSASYPQNGAAAVLWHTSTACWFCKMSDGNLECVEEQVLVKPFQRLRESVFPFIVWTHSVLTFTLTLHRHPCIVVLLTGFLSIHNEQLNLTHLK